MSWIEDVRGELRALDLSPRSLRRFAVTLGAFLLLLSAWALFRRHAALRAAVLGSVAAVLLAAGALRPLALRPLYRAWMALAVGLGWVTSRLVVTAVFLLAVTPVALVARLVGTRFLEIRRDRSATTYWTRRARTPATYDRMY